ncbi:MAG: aldo/keto reductase [Phycisphaeraceae bacterium]|nr:aldo/keto reductase [Phycisphaeraceae bacterium]
MNYVSLGRTGVQVSQLCFGTMSFGGDADEDTSAAMFHRCRETGINFFDCANVYANGRSEEILGGLMRGCRDEIVLTSKAGMPLAGSPVDRGLSRRHLFQQIETSLRRLETDRLDVYFVHHFDPRTPMDQTLRALDDLVRQGKILYAGVSNWSAWQIARSLGYCDQHDLAPFLCIQPMYNLVKRQAEVEILPMAEAENLSVIAYSPLGGGLLTGKYGSSAHDDTGDASPRRLADMQMYTNRYGDPALFDVARSFSAMAQAHGVHPATLAVAWVGTHPAVTCPIIGARNLEQLEPSLAAAEFDMAPELRAKVTALTPDPALATDRAEEKEGLPLR